VGVAFFFALAFSPLENWLKGGLMLAVLVACGAELKRVTGWDGYYGLLVVRGFAGLDLMEIIGKRYAHACRFIVDAGLTLCFGIPYGAYVFGWMKKRWLAGVLLNIIFFVFFFTAQSSVSVGGEALAFLLLGWGLGLFGVGIGFLGLHAWRVLTVPNTPPGVTLLLPGVTVPWEAVFAIAIIAVVHELAHGILARAERVRIKSSGALLFGFLPVGAFVEIDEKAFAKEGVHVKRRVLAAGSISNALFFFVFLFLAAIAGALLDSTVVGVSVSALASNSTLSPGISPGDNFTGFASAREARAFFTALAASGEGAAAVEVNGANRSVRFAEVVVQGVRDGYPSAWLFTEGAVIERLDGVPVEGLNSLSAALKAKGAGNVVAVDTSAGSFNATLGANSQLGLTLAESLSFEVEDIKSDAFAYSFYSFLFIALAYAYLLNFVLAMVNLLPLFITDGHRVLLEEFREILPEKQAQLAYLAFGAGGLALLALNALPWLWA